MPSIDLGNPNFMYYNMVNECGVGMEGGCQMVSLYPMVLQDMLINPSLAEG